MRSTVSVLITPVANRQGTGWVFCYWYVSMKMYSVNQRSALRRLADGNKRSPMPPRITIKKCLSGNLVLLLNTNTECGGCGAWGGSGVLGCVGGLGALQKRATDKLTCPSLLAKSSPENGSPCLSAWCALHLCLSQRSIRDMPPNYSTVALLWWWRRWIGGREVWERGGEVKRILQIRRGTAAVHCLLL